LIKSQKNNKKENEPLSECNTCRR